MQAGLARPPTSGHGTPDTTPPPKTSAAPGVYRRHRPETTALYAVVRDNLETLFGIPFPWRPRLAQEREACPWGTGQLLARLTQIFVDTVQAFYVRRATLAGGTGAKTDAMTAVQRTSSDLRLNPRLHTIALDGTWDGQGSELVARGQAARSSRALDTSRQARWAMCCSMRSDGSSATSTSAARAIPRATSPPPRPPANRLLPGHNGRVALDLSDHAMEALAIKLS